ncbi:MAG: SpoIIE family protein phosphatase, partial [Planctomycetes bacterium]|nr:SpoIIE family protein phosphatase [Planctomycetota bacterium]
MTTQTESKYNRTNPLVKPKALLVSTLDQLGLESYQTLDSEKVNSLNADIAVFTLNHLADINNETIKLLTEQIQLLSIGILVLTSDTPEQIDQFLQSNDTTHMVFADTSESSQMLQGRLITLIEMCSSFQELNRLEMVQQPLNQYFTQVDEEMRLAARLQQDFLPRELPKFPNMKFATVFRPASWVSGDVFDVMRLDEKHVGFYIADAVGHGVPAALLTMFIKRALVTKVIEGKNYTLIEPGVALSRLNDDMVGQDLTNFQFATGCYAILNIETLQMRIASGGHPPPILIDKNGNSKEIEVSGSLLGVFPDQVYDTTTVQLNPDDKLLMFSDGVEVAFVNEGPDQPLRFHQEFGNLAEYDI